jgi:hypothetical protein
MRTEFVYRSHCRELLDRAARGEDTRPGTAAECCIALSETSLRVPLRTSAAGLYARMWTRAQFPPAAPGRRQRALRSAGRLAHRRARNVAAHQAAPALARPATGEHPAEAPTRPGRRHRGLTRAPPGPSHATRAPPAVRKPNPTTKNGEPTMTMTMTMTTTGSAPANPAPSLAAFTPDLGCFAAVNLSGRLSLPSPDDAAGTGPMSRRTHTGTAYRIDLGGGIACWLDGDHQDGSGGLNWVATQMCTELSGGTFTDPWDAPFVCGPALFTATAAGGTGPAALSDEQLRRVVDAHAASADDPFEVTFAAADEPAPALR